MPAQRQCFGTCHPDGRLFTNGSSIHRAAYYEASSMKAIGIRCWPDSHHALPGCPSEGAERRGATPRAPSHSQRPIASEASNAPTARLVPAGTSTCRRKRPGFPSILFAQVFLRPALRPAARPLHMMSGCAHDVRLHTHALFVFSTDIYIDRPQPPRWYASG